MSRLKLFWLLNMTFMTANSADTDEMSHSAVSHLGQHDLSICINGLMGYML